MDGQQAFERSLPYQFRQLLHEIDAIATPGGQGIVLWRRFTPIATLSLREASLLTPRKVSTIKSAFGARHRNSTQVARWDRGTRRLHDLTGQAVKALDLALIW